jgi:hypothetical protein
MASTMKQITSHLSYSLKDLVKATDMEVYLSEDYLPVLENILNEKCNDLFNIEKIYNIKSITKLITALPVFTDISFQKAKDLLENFNDQTNRNNIRSSLISSLINASNFYPINFNLTTEIPNYSGYYFISDQKLAFNAEQKGLAIKNQNYKGEEYYNKLTCAHVNLEDNDYSSLNERIPPCNAMVIYDRYLFTPFNKKFKNLKTFIEIFSKGLKIPFHLTLIFSSKNGLDELISSHDLIKCFSLLNQNNIQTQFIINNQNNEDRLSSDRLIYTNYTTINIGHPFHKYRTVFNQNFLGSGYDEREIKKNYEMYKSDLSNFSKIIELANKNYCYSFEMIEERINKGCNLFSINPGFQNEFVNSLFNPKIQRKNKIQLFKKSH